MFFIEIISKLSPVLLECLAPTVVAAAAAFASPESGSLMAGDSLSGRQTHFRRQWELPAGLNGSFVNLRASFICYGSDLWLLWSGVEHLDIVLVVADVNVLSHFTRIASPFFHTLITSHSRRLLSGP